MTEKWGQIQGKSDLVRASGGGRVIPVRVAGVPLYVNLISFFHFKLNFYRVHLTAVQLK